MAAAGALWMGPHRLPQWSSAPPGRRRRTLTGASWSTVLLPLALLMLAAVVAAPSRRLVAAGAGSAAGRASFAVGYPASARAGSWDVGPRSRSAHGPSGDAGRNARQLLGRRVERRCVLRPSLPSSMSSVAIRGSPARYAAPRARADDCPAPAPSMRLAGGSARRRAGYGAADRGANDLGSS